ncbi:MAG: MJ0042-type zinc finger domain-containing protein [Planctomycetaceae bacterium]
MPSPLTIRCPECKAKLKVQDASKLGQRVACPRCKHSFIAQSAGGPSTDSIEIPVEIAPSENLPHGGVLRRGNYSSTEIQASPPSAPPLFARLGDNAILYIGGGLLALLLLTYLLIFTTGGPADPPRHPSLAGGPAVDRAPAPSTSLASASPTAPANPSGSPRLPDPATTVGPRNDAARPLDLAYLPPQAELVAVWRPTEMSRGELFSPLLATPMIQSLRADWEDLVGLPAAALETVTLGIAGSSSLFADASATPNLIAGLLKSDAILVARLRPDLDAQTLRLESRGHSAAQHRGKTYYRGPALAGGGGRLGIAVSGRSLVLLGPEFALRAALERGDKPLPRPELTFVDAQAPLVVALVPQRKAWLGRLLALGLLGDATGGLPPAVEQKIRGASLALFPDGPERLLLAIDSGDLSAADELQRLIDARLRGDQAPDTLPATSPLTALTAGSQCERRANLVCISGTLAPSAGSILAKLPDTASALLGVPAGTMPIFDNAMAGPRRSASTLLGVPDKTTLYGFARWQEAGPAPADLQIVVDLQGGAAATAAAHERCAVARAVADGSLALKPAPATGPPSMRIDHTAGALHPADGLRLVIPFVPPDRACTTINDFVAAVKLRVPRETKVVQIKNARVAAGRLNAPEFKAAGVTCTLTAESDRLTFRARGADTQLIGAVQLASAAGTPLAGPLMATIVDLPGDLEVTLPLAPDASPDVGLLVSVHSGFREVPVPLHFEGLEVPPPPRQRR